MNRLSFTVELATDGGCVVYADNGGTQQELVFAGNTKDTNDYIAKRVGALKADTNTARETEYVYDAGLQRHIKASEYQRTAREFATDMLDLKRIDEATRYAVEA